MYTGPIIDADVHHNWVTERELIPYLAPRWREYVTGWPRGRPSLTATAGAGGGHPAMGGLPYRHDAIPTSGIPGSDYELLRSQLLDRHQVQLAILGYDIGANGGLMNLELAADVCRAANDWNLEKWLSIPDERLRGTVMLASQQPEIAAREIRRVGRHPRVAAALLVANGMDKPFGHPVYDPIYEAAVEMGLPVQLHGGSGSLVQSNAAGRLGTRAEWHSVANAAVAQIASSYIVHGAFERHPNLRVMLVEMGVAWIPWLLWSLDQRYHDLRRESSWVRRLPSEYFRDHVRVTTQPLEIPARPERLLDVLESYEGMEDLLCFATDYPHWDADNPLYVTRHLPESWLPKVMYSNAAGFYGWARPLARPSPQAAVN